MASPQTSPTPATASTEEMSAFIQELEQASHMDAATRNDILTTVFQAPPELRSGLVRQYRALLALPSMSAYAETPFDKAATVPATVPRPGMAAGSEQVVAASHQEAIDSPPDRDPSAEGDAPELERLLQAYLQEKKTKGEAAAYATTTDQPKSRVNGGDKDARPTSDNATWKQLVDSAIEKLEAQRQRQLDSELCEEDEARLRMLYLIADRRDDAVRAIASPEPEMQEYWSKQFFALSTLLDTDLISDRSNRLIESKRNLDEAVRRLGESAPLFVRNLVFVTNVQSYGAYTPLDENEFQPGEKVLLYAEVENYRCKETARGYHTSLRNSYEIFDGDRQKVAEHEFSTIEEYCENARRDFFTVCEFRIPDKLSPGKYVLRLTIADLNGDKAGESSITFHIGDGK